MPAPERPTSPIFSPGRMVRSKSATTGRGAVGLCRSVGEGHLVEADLAVAHRQRPGARRVGERDGLREGRDAVADGADVLEERRDLPHDPLRHAVQAQHEADADRDRADRHEAVDPQADAHRADAEEQQRVEEQKADEELGDETPLPVDGLQEQPHRILGVGHLARGVGEELHGADIGVGVDDAAGHLGARVGLPLGDGSQRGMKYRSIAT